jgi:aspartyl protease family protein
MSVLMVAPLGAVEEITVLGLFSGKALINVDGHRRLLREGETSPEGVKLIRADSREAVIEVSGQQSTHGLGRSARIRTTYAAPQVNQARIMRNDAGSYLTVGSINGRTVTFLVDTGASWVAMNSNEAERLGLRHRQTGQAAGVHTASGYASGYAVKLDRVRVGDIQVNNVDAVVIEGDYPPMVLLGMSFLNQVKLEHEGQVLTLKSRR